MESKSTVDVHLRHSYRYISRADIMLPIRPVYFFENVSAGHRATALARYPRNGHVFDDNEEICEFMFPIQCLPFCRRLLCIQKYDGYIILPSLYPNPTLSPPFISEDIHLCIGKLLSTISFVSRWRRQNNNYNNWEVSSISIGVLRRRRRLYLTPPPFESFFPLPFFLVSASVLTDVVKMRERVGPDYIARHARSYVYSIRGREEIYIQISLLRVVQQHRSSLRLLPSLHNTLFFISISEK